MMTAWNYITSDTIPELLLLVILALPGVDGKPDDKGPISAKQPFIISPFYDMVELLPKDWHAKMADIARKRGYCPQDWICGADLPPVAIKLLHNNAVEIANHRPYTPFWNCVRAYHRGGFIRDFVRWKVPFLAR